MTPRTIVVSGFEPFGAADENPTLQVLDLLRAAPPLPAGLVTLVLPVDTSRIADIVREVLRDLKPKLWIGLGLAMGSSVVAVERIGVNVLDFAIPDNAGRRAGGDPVFADGPAAYLATIPVAAIVKDLRAAGIPARISNSASTYLCNQLMYTVLHLATIDDLDMKVGFIHVPAHPALAARLDGTFKEMPSMSIDLMAAAVRLAIETSLAPIALT